MCITCGVIDCHFNPSWSQPKCRRQATHKAALNCLTQCVRKLSGITTEKLSDIFYQNQYNTVSFARNEIVFGVCVPEDIIGNRGLEMGEPDEPLRCEIFADNKYIKTKNICDLVKCITKRFPTPVAVSSTPDAVSSTPVAVSSTPVAVFDEMKLQLSVATQSLKEALEEVDRLKEVIRVLLK